MTIVHDTVWIDYLAGTVKIHMDRLERKLHQRRLEVTHLIWCEILRGTRSHSTFKGVSRDLSTCEGHSLLHRDHDFGLFENHLGLLVVHP